MISVKTVCDKCGNAIDGRVYNEHVNGSYEFCPRCRAKVVDE